MLERDIQERVLLALAGDRRIRIWRAATGKLQTPDGKWVQFGLPGQADLSGIVVGSGRRLEVEVKTETGRLSVRQVAFQDMIRASGGIYLTVRSPEEARALLEPFLA
jgi:hypothetical protein